MLKVVEYPNGWSRYNNIYVFDYDWQQPAKTELWAFEKLRASSKSDFFTQYICFPWATLIDYLDYQPQKANVLLRALNNRPPKMAIKIITFCQHIYALKMLPHFKALGITDIYWSHKIKGQDVVEGVKIHSYPLFPVMHHKRTKPYVNKPLLERKYLYSFIGSYQPDLYLTPVRKWIFNLPKRNDAIVKERSEWHFEQDVYQQQLLGVNEDQVNAEIRKKQEKEYIEVMEDTVFCLCPSGSGPNSIRLWEAIEFGCVPVILSDTLDYANLLRGEIKEVCLESKDNVFNLPLLLKKNQIEYY